MSRHDHVSPGFGDRLRQSRVDAGLSQRELSFDGCSSVYLCRIEKGDRVPSLQLVRELARRLNVSERWLATGEGSQLKPIVVEIDVATVEQSIGCSVESLDDETLERVREASRRAATIAAVGAIIDELERDVDRSVTS